MSRESFIQAAVARFEVELRKAVEAVEASTGPRAFAGAERRVHDLTTELADHLVGSALQRMCRSQERTRAEVARLRDAAPTMTLKLQGMRRTPVMLLGGTVVSLEAHYLYARPIHPTKTTRGPAGTGVFPVLDSIGIADRSTPALRFRVAHAVVEASSVGSAREQLAQAGLEVEHKQALRFTYAVADSALTSRAAEIQRRQRRSGPLSGRKVVAAVDGGRVRVRHALRGAPKKGGRRPFELNWREPKVLTIYVVDEHGRRDKTFRSVIDGTLGDADAVVRLLAFHLRRLGAHEAAHLTLIGDGAPWIWKRALRLRDDVGLPAERFTEVLDYFHVVERLYEFARSRPGWSEARATAWALARKKQLKQGEIATIIRAIRGLVTAEEAKDGSTLEYWTRNRERMRYDRFRTHGLPIGSGAVESAVRRVLNLRMKSTGTFWKENHAEGMLHLRAYSKAGRWSEIEESVLAIAGWKPKRRRRFLK